jgi:catechol-2,3-dioxygenase
MPEWAKVSHTSFSVIYPASATLLEYQQQEAHRGERFDPRRTGLDHVGFQVPSRAALNDWLDHFEALGVEHSPIADREYGVCGHIKAPSDLDRAVGPATFLAAHR